MKAYSETKDNVDIHGFQCAKCGETFFSASEILRWEVLSGRRKENVRKIRKVGNSVTVTLPNKLVEEDDVKNDDYAIFLKTRDGYMIRIVHA